MKKIYYVRIVLPLIVLLFVSCGTESTPVYTLTSQVQPAEAGTVSQSATEAEEGESITVTANPNEHWVFQGWSGDFSGSQNPGSVVMDTDKTVTAMFEKREYPLTLNQQGEGVINERVIPSKTTNYEHGTTVELDAVAATGWEFTGWQGDAQGDQTPIQVTVNAETTITAVFERINYDLTVTVQGEGSVEQEIIQNKTTEYPFETMVRLTAVPAENWEFLRWEGDASGSDPQVDVEIREETSVTAIFRHQNEGLQVKVFDESRYTVELVDGQITQGDLLGRYVRKFNIDGLFTEFKNYDELGNITDFETIEYNSDGEIVFSEYSSGRFYYKITYTRDQAGRIVESFREDEDGLVRRTEFTYDASGNLIEERVYNSDNNLFILYRMEYDSQGNVIRELWLDPDTEEVRWSFEYSYNASNERIEVIQYDAENNMLFRTTYEYDSFGNMVELKRYDSEGNLTYREVHSFNSDGQRTLREIFDENNQSVFRNEYVYNEAGQIVETKNYDAGVLGRTIEFIYDADGRLVERTFIYHESGDEMKTTYEDFDVNSHWRLSVNYTDGEPEVMTLRSIEYHDRPAAKGFFPEANPWMQMDSSDLISRHSFRDDGDSGEVRYWDGARNSVESTIPAWQDLLDERTQRGHHNPLNPTTPWAEWPKHR